MNSKSEELFEELLKLEDRLWNREDVGDDDLPLFSHAIDFIVANKDRFIKFIDDKEKTC